MNQIVKKLEKKLATQIEYELMDDVRSNERFFGIFLVIFNFSCLLFYIFHQINSTGFFSNKFGFIEMIMLYGSFITWIITASLESIFNKKHISRLFDLYGGMEFLSFSSIWLLVVFPFDFTFFSDILPYYLEFSLRWISNDIAKICMILYSIFLIGGMLFSIILRIFVMRANNREIPTKIVK